jgi:hypothetical protein
MKNHPTHPPVRAWRLFDVVTSPNGRSHLVSPIHNGMPMYPNQVYKADCIHSWGQHDAPQFDCTCGFYAFKKRRDARSYLRQTIMAEVLLGGRIIETEIGYRAEQMIIVKLYPTKKEVRHEVGYL